MSVHVKSDDVRHLEIKVEGRKSLCVAVFSELMSLADDHHPQSTVSFELKFSSHTTWMTEAHEFQV